MKKAIAIILAIAVITSATLIGCSKSSDESEETTTQNGLSANTDEYVWVEEEVTDENGETVTDEDGNPVTEDVMYKSVVDSDGKTHYYKVDNNGDFVKDSDGNYIEADEKDIVTTTMKDNTTQAVDNDQHANDGEGTTSSELTTLSVSQDKVPTTSETGKTVSFSSEDQDNIIRMLQVPYLYEANYENADGVPTEIAAHAAIWMAEREGLNTSTYASGTVVLGLFRFFGQTVVNFKTLCNDGKGNAPITYNSSNDTFYVSSSETPAQKVTLTKIEFLGNNNYYKVTGNVSGAGSISRVVAVIQKNKLDKTLGFSIKALKWS